ncbi:hypothetical protein KCU66_g66, partial [Aureobasidium melanogenum]
LLVTVFHCSRSWEGLRRKNMVSNVVKRQSRHCEWICDTLKSQIPGSQSPPLPDPTYEDPGPTVSAKTRPRLYITIHCRVGTERRTCCVVRGQINICLSKDEGPQDEATVNKNLPHALLRVVIHSSARLRRSLHVPNRCLSHRTRDLQVTLLRFPSILLLQEEKLLQTSSKIRTRLRPCFGRKDFVSVSVGFGKEDFAIFRANVRECIEDVSYVACDLSGMSIR